MSVALTIRDLEETVEQKLRVKALRHGRSLEAEVREILTQAATQNEDGAFSTPTSHPESVRSSIRGIWKGRLSTDELMTLTRGD